MERNYIKEEKNMKKTIASIVFLNNLLLAVWSCKEDGGVNEPHNHQLQKKNSKNL